MGKKNLKKCGGLRLIAVDETLRRLVQLGAGVRFGTEGAAHAALSFINNMLNDMLHLKIELAPPSMPLEETDWRKHSKPKPQKFTMFSFQKKVSSKVTQLHGLVSAFLFIICSPTSF